MVALVLTLVMSSSAPTPPVASRLPAMSRPQVYPRVRLPDASVSATRAQPS